MNSKDTEKVIVLKGKTLKRISIGVRFLLSIIIAVASQMLLNNGTLGLIIFLLCFFFGNKLKRIGRLFLSVQKLIQKYIMRSIGIEVFMINIISLGISGVIYFVAYHISYEHLLTALLWAMPVYVIVFQLLIIRKIKYIKEISNGIQEISKGDLDYKVTEKGNDEFRILAENINKMSIDLKNKIEDERRAEKTKNELITNVSHDLKTPLTTIIGYLTLVRDKKYDGEKEMEDYIERAYSKSLRLKKLIEDLFEYTKITNGVIRVNKSSVNIVELMEQLLGEMSVLAKQNNLSFEKDYLNSEIYLNVDSDLMARTFENILSNSIKYSYKELNSKILISITQNEEHVLLSFENKGDTIPTEVLPLLFERFYRGDQSRNSKVSGSGLGLAIAKSIVELHDGRISAESEANRVRITVELKNQ